MGKILSISLKLNFAPNTLGGSGLIELLIPLPPVYMNSPIPSKIYQSLFATRGSKLQDIGLLMSETAYSHELGH